MNTGKEKRKKEQDCKSQDSYKRLGIHSLTLTHKPMSHINEMAMACQYFLLFSQRWVENSPENPWAQRNMEIPIIYIE